ncbi:Rieske 2Fe-2S domain-containing protein [Patescibacteria group bacterium]|nr:Rieske 2Fe-2S domain-containing protein [Patescibacteria group bacterium]
MAEQWVRLAALAEIPDGSIRKFRIDFRSGWLLRRGEAVKAYFDQCTHAGGSLIRKGEIFQCLRHEATFDIETGIPLSGPALDGDPLPTVELKVEDGVVFFKRILSDD